MSGNAARELALRWDNDDPGDFDYQDAPWVLERLIYTDETTPGGPLGDLLNAVGRQHERGNGYRTHLSDQTQYTCLCGRSWPCNLADAAAAVEAALRGETP